MIEKNPNHTNNNKKSSYGFEYGSEEWLEALDYPEQDREAVSRNRKMALKAGMGDPNAAWAPQPSGPPMKRGSRGGYYTTATTKDGRPYRRYF